MTAPSRKAHRHSWIGKKAGEPFLWCADEECQATLGPVDANTLEGKAANLDALLRNVGEPGTCRGCSAPIYWIVHRNNKRAPYTPEGLDHFADCAASGQFRR